MHCTRGAWIDGVGKMIKLISLMNKRKNYKMNEAADSFWWFWHEQNDPNVASFVELKELSDERVWLLWKHVTRLASYYENTKHIHCQTTTQNVHKILQSDAMAKCRRLAGVAYPSFIHSFGRKLENKILNLLMPPQRRHAHIGDYNDLVVIIGLRYESLLHRLAVDDSVPPCLLVSEANTNE